MNKRDWQIAVHQYRFLDLSERELIIIALNVFQFWAVLQARMRMLWLIIGPRSDHSLRMSLTDWLTDDLVGDWMNWPKYADYTDYADYADYAEYAKYANYAECAEYAKYEEYAEYAEYAENLPNQTYQTYQTKPNLT